MRLVWKCRDILSLLMIMCHSCFLLNGVDNLFYLGLIFIFSVNVVVLDDILKGLLECFPDFLVHLQLFRKCIRHRELVIFSCLPPNHWCSHTPTAVQITMLLQEPLGTFRQSETTLTIELLCEPTGDAVTWVAWRVSWANIALTDHLWGDDTTPVFLAVCAIRFN